MGPYSQAVVVGDMVFVSGQIPINPATGELIKTSFREAARQAIINVVEIVRAAGGDVESIAKVTVYLKDITRFSEFNDIYDEILRGHKPARVVVGVASIPRDADLMIDAIAYLK